MSSVKTDQKTTATVRSNTSKLAFWLAGAACLAVTAGAMGQVTLISDSRRVELSASTTIGDRSVCSNSSTVAPMSPFGLFEADEPVTCLSFEASAIGFGSQSSRILSNSATGVGVCSAQIQGLSPSGATNVSALSRFGLVFRVDSPISYEFTSSFSQTAGVSRAKLRIVAGAEVFSASTAEGSTGLNTSGELAAATYELELESTSTVSLSGLGLTQGNAGFGFSFALGGPICRADINNDGTVDPDDLSDFITGFFSTPPAPQTDFNNDGTVDPDDLSDYITLFFQGC